LITGDEDGLDANISRIHGGIAYPLVQNLTIGFNVRHVRGSLSDTVNDEGERVARDVRVWNGDVGVSGNFGNVGFGVVYQNALNTDENEEAFTPRAIAGGVSVSFGQLVLAGDLVNSINDDENEQSFSVGAEYFLQDSYALRAGYRYEPFIRRNLEADNESIVSGGLGYVTGEGAVDLGFFRSLERANNWQFIAAVRLFL
ncbi:MAG: porin, partial [Myxococcota bacterium]